MGKPVGVLVRTADELVAEYTEVESGKRSDRPELEKALAACKKQKAKLVIAKLDRLYRCRTAGAGRARKVMVQNSLILKRASASRPSGEWNDDDFDVLADGVTVGRIMKVRGAHAYARLR